MADEYNIVHDIIRQHVDKYYPHDKINLDITSITEDVLDEIEQQTNQEFAEQDFVCDMAYVYVQHLMNTGWYEDLLDEADRLYQEYLEEQRNPYKTRGLNPGMF